MSRGRAAPLLSARPLDRTRRGDRSSRCSGVNSHPHRRRRAFSLLTHPLCATMHEACDLSVNALVIMIAQHGLAQGGARRAWARAVAARHTAGRFGAPQGIEEDLVHCKAAKEIWSTLRQLNPQNGGARCPQVHENASLPENAPNPGAGGPAPAHVSEKCLPPF